MRIVGGSLRSRKIKMVGIDSTRETQDRVRESVFNMIGPLHGTVLDLFAGSGSYGLEAYSRGAKNIYLNDHHTKAYQTILENVQTLKIPNAIVSKLDAFAWLKQYQDIKFDYIFIDPPYGYTQMDALIKILEVYLKEDGLLIIESDQKDHFECHLNQIKEKVYGYKRIVIFQK